MAKYQVNGLAMVSCLLCVEDVATEAEARAIAEGCGLAPLPHNAFSGDADRGKAWEFDTDGEPDVVSIEVDSACYVVHGLVGVSCHVYVEASSAAAAKLKAAQLQLAPLPDNAFRGSEGQWQVEADGQVEILSCEEVED